MVRPVRCAALLGQLDERDAVGWSAADVVDLAREASQVAELHAHEIVQIDHVQHVAHLQSVPAEARERELAAIFVSRRPERDEALIRLAHLPRSRDEPAAVDDRPQAVHRVVFLDEQLGGQLARAVERSRPARRKALGDAARRPAQARGAGGELQSITPALERQRHQRGNRVDAAGREKHDARVVPAGGVETARRAREIRVEHIRRAAVIAGVHGRLGRTFDQHVEGPRVREVVGRADVAVPERDAAGPESVERELAAAAPEVVEGRDVDARDVALEEERQGRSDEPGAARDEALHRANVHQFRGPRRQTRAGRWR